jgi:glycosyltransferase involved in cell wall biosynthesis
VSALREAGPVDRFVAHWLLPCAVLLALLGDAPLEAWGHGADVRAFCRMPATARRAVASALLDRGTSFVFVSHDLRARLLASLPAATAERVHERSRVTPAPIRVPARAALADPRLPGELEGGYVVWVGRQIPSKRSAAAARAATSAGLPLVMIGDGPLTPPSGAVALGRLARHDTLRWIAHARALVSTSEVEGAPTVVREARALGVPVVARPCGDLARWASLDGGIHLANEDDDIAVILRHVALSA